MVVTVTIAQKITRRMMQNVFVQISKCICPNFKMYLSKFQNVFVQISKCICSYLEMYLSTIQNVFVQIVGQSLGNKKWQKLIERE